MYKYVFVSITSHFDLHLKAIINFGQTMRLSKKKEIFQFNEILNSKNYESSQNRLAQENSMQNNFEPCQI